MPFTLGLNFAMFETDLFIDGVDASVEQQQLSLVGSWHLDRITVSANATLIADGHLGFRSGAPLDPVRGDRPFEALRYDFRPGFAAGAGISWQALTTYDHPFDLTLSAQLAFATATIAAPWQTADNVRNEADWLAFDVRVGVTVSRTFARIFTPWVAARVFGGPIILTGRLPNDGSEATSGGTDTRHIQLAAGMALRPLPTSLPGLRVFIEGAAISERGFSLGLSHTF